MLFWLQWQWGETRVRLGAEWSHFAGLGWLIEQLGSTWLSQKKEDGGSDNDNEKTDKNKVPHQLAAATGIVGGRIHLNTTVLTCR